MLHKAFLNVGSEPPWIDFVFPLKALCFGWGPLMGNPCVIKFLCVSPSALSGWLAIDRGWVSFTWLMAADSSRLHSVGPRLSLGRPVVLNCAPPPLPSILSLLTLHFWIKFASEGHFPFRVSHVPKETTPESVRGA